MTPSDANPWIGMDVDHRICRVRFKHAAETKPIDPPGSWWSTIRVAKGRGGNIFVVGLASDSPLDAGPWTEGEGPWEAEATRIGDTLWREIVIGKQANSDGLQVISLRKNDNKLFVAAIQDSYGNWYPDTYSLSQADDHGRWNAVDLVNVPDSFHSVPSTYSQDITYAADRLDYPGPLDITTEHFQGMAHYKRYYLLIHSTSKREGGAGEIFVFDRIQKKEIFVLPGNSRLREPSRPHSGRMPDRWRLSCRRARTI